MYRSLMMHPPAMPQQYQVTRSRNQGTIPVVLLSRWAIYFQSGRASLENATHCIFRNKTANPSAHHNKKEASKNMWRFRCHGNRDLLSLDSVHTLLIKFQKRKSQSPTNKTSAPECMPQTNLMSVPLLMPSLTWLIIPAFSRHTRWDIWRMTLHRLRLNLHW